MTRDQLKDLIETGDYTWSEIAEKVEETIEELSEHATGQEAEIEWMGALLSACHEARLDINGQRRVSALLATVDP